MLEKDGWTLRYDEDNYCFVIEFPERGLMADFYIPCSTKGYSYLKNMVSGRMPKHEVLIMDKLNGIVNRIEKLEQELQQMNKPTKRMIS